MYIPQYTSLEQSLLCRQSDTRYIGNIAIVLCNKCPGSLIEAQQKQLSHATILSLIHIRRQFCIMLHLCVFFMIFEQEDHQKVL